VPDDLLARRLGKPELVIVDGGKGLEAALASLWDYVPVQRCSVHKERNLIAHAPKHLHDDIKANFNDLIYAQTAGEVFARRKGSCREGGGNSAAGLRKHGGWHQAARSISVGERSRVCQPSTRRMVI
jgi:hypothetical protein